MVPRQPQVSVIMPAYNVAGYVRRAVESLQRQSLTNFELLVVNDGSSDRTGEILDSMAERDYRIRVFHTENGGAPAARNLALDHAKGDYIYFMDADDWAEPSMLEDMRAFAEQKQLELVVSGFYIDTYYGKDNQYTTEVKSRPNALYASSKEFRAAAWQLFDANQLYTPWNKLFVRERIEKLHVRFRPTFWDDFPFVLDYIRDIERVGVIERPYYHFIRQRSESETARWRPNMYDKREEEHGWMLDLYLHWGLSEDPSSQEMIQRRYIERLVGCIENVCNPSCDLSRTEKIKLIKRMIDTDRVRIALRHARPKSRMMQLMLAPIRKNSARLCYLEGRFISFVKRHNTKLFAQLKARR